MAYYYTRDHLGSVREMVNSSGSIVARYSYDPYGNTTLSSGTNLATFQYTGDYYHATSGLSSTIYRAYDPNTSRWLSRDPLPDAEMSQGANLYDYVKNNPIHFSDVLGLAINPSDVGSVWSLGGGFFVGVGGEGGVEKIHLPNGQCQWFIYAGTGFGLFGGIGTQEGAVGNTYGNPNNYAGSFYTAQAGAGVWGMTGSVAPGANGLPGQGGIILDKWWSRRGC